MSNELYENIILKPKLNKWLKENGGWYEDDGIECYKEKSHYNSGTNYLSTMLKKVYDQQLMSMYYDSAIYGNFIAGGINVITYTGTPPVTITGTSND